MKEFLGPTSATSGTVNVGRPLVKFPKPASDPHAASENSSSSSAARRWALRSWPIGLVVENFSAKLFIMGEVFQLKEMKDLWSCLEADAARVVARYVLFGKMYRRQQRNPLSDKWSSWLTTPWSVTQVLWSICHISHPLLIISCVWCLTSLGLRQRFWKFIRTKFGISNGAMTGHTLQVRVKTDPRSYGVEESVFFDLFWGTIEMKLNNHVFLSQVIPWFWLIVITRLG